MAKITAPAGRVSWVSTTPVTRPSSTSQADGPVLFVVDARPLQGIEKGVDHVGGPVGTGKNTSPSFRLQGDA